MIPSCNRSPWSDYPPGSSGNPQGNFPPSGSPLPGTPPPGNPLPPDLNQDLDSEDEESNLPNNLEHSIRTGNPDLLDTQDITVYLDDLKDTLVAIREIRNASLNTQFDEDDLANLRNPTKEELDINDCYFHLSLDMYLILTNAPQETYCEPVSAFLRCHPEVKGRLLSYDQIKCRVKNLTSIIPIHDNMCINSCMAFTSPYKDLDSCLKCLEYCYDPVLLHSSNGATKKPQQSMTTIPIGPQIQALWSHHLSAEKMSYWEQITETLLNQDESPNILTDYTEGEDYLMHMAPHLKLHDTILMFSVDRAQLYRNKRSDCWMYIWVIYDLTPGDHYKKQYVLPGGFVPGPNAPKNLDSFFFSGIYHLSALQHEGLLIWDAHNWQLHHDNPFLFFATADAIGIVDVSGSAGHHARLGCQLMCELPGRHKPGTGHYYPALLKPSDCTHCGSNHNDIDINTISNPDDRKYQANLLLLLSSTNPNQHVQHQHETGQIKLYGSDKKDTWDWAVFMDT
ncbi:hypothetical protein BDM02DRAFT_3131806 [Thelephora ganbajun]|uniref:Uncharacterized protein n=1 Tax=Thelephora ganbajun TaxID=370292 RepID=A0ACB6Z3V7_THEGA|nr:hypothetical protein BDM02DRAFT_3131806 [Thelephora ganbajun]